jgi:nitrogen fixation-related uncharacterized protein
MVCIIVFSVRLGQVMTLTFIWPITNGLLDALERIEGSAQRVLSTQRRQHLLPNQTQHQQSGPRGCWSSVQAWRREQQQWLQPLLALLAIQPGLQAVKQALFKDLPHALSSKQSKARSSVLLNKAEGTHQHQQQAMHSMQQTSRTHQTQHLPTGMAS